MKISNPDSVGVNPQAPVSQKIADEVVFDVSKVKETIFFNRTSLTLPQIFDAHLLEYTDFVGNLFF